MKRSWTWRDVLPSGAALTVRGVATTEDGLVVEVDDNLGHRAALQKQLMVLRNQIGNLTNALAEGRAVKSVVAALQEREQEQEALQTELDQITNAAQSRPVDLSKINRKVRARFGELLDQLSQHLDVARDVLRTVLTKRIVFRPEPEAKVCGSSGS